MLKYVLLAVAFASVQAQLLANTPGGVRSVPTASDPDSTIESAGTACSSSRDPGCSDLPSSEPVIPVELQVLSGQVLFESLFPNLEAISQQDQQSLMSTMMAVHNMSNSAAGGPITAADSNGAKSSDASSSPAAGGANSAVLVAPAITPSEATGFGINPGDLPPLPLPGSGDSFGLPAQTVTTVSHKLPPGIRQTGAADAATTTSNSSDVASNDSSSKVTSDIPQDVNSMPVLGSSGQSASDVTTAAGTVAATIPVMGQYAQIIVSSLKMLPINADQFSKVSGTGAAALTWEQKVEQGLVEATANATTIPPEQIHSKLTCVLNLALELPEPPTESAAAAATTIANKIQALTNDSSVLVGVSLVRLGGGGGSSSSSSAAAASTPATAVSSAWLDTAAAYNGSSNGSALVKGKARTLKAAAAALPGNTSSSGPLNVTASSGKGSALVLLSIYGVESPANVVDVAQSLQNNCPGLFKYGSNINSTTCGASIIAAYQSAISTGAAAVASAGQPASKRILRVTEIGTKAAAPDSSEAGSIGNSTTSNSSHLPAVRLTSAAGSSSTSNFTVTSIRVRQQPEVNIIVSQAVGITANQPAADVVLKLQSFSSSFTLPQVLAKYGLSVSQAGVPQIVEIQDSGPLETGSSDTAAPRLDSSSSSSTAGAGGNNGVVIGVAVAAAVAVAAVSAAAVAIVMVKQRARAAATKAASEANGMPHKKHRKGGKSKGISSRYLPTTFFSPQGPDHAAAAAGPNTQQACKPTAGPTIVAVQLPASLAPLSPALSPSGALLLPSTGQAAAAAAAAAVAAARASPLLSPLGVRPGPVPVAASLSPHTSGGAAPVAGGQLTLLTQLTRGDSVSSAVRFDLEVDNSNISADGSETEEADDNLAAQQQQQQLPVGRVGPGHSVRVTMVSGSHQAGNTIRDGVGGTSSRASAALPRTASMSDMQQEPAASVNNPPPQTQQEARCSSSSRDVASPEWWSTAADASLALMSAAARGAATSGGAACPASGSAMHQHQHHLSGCASATCGCNTKDPAHLRVLSRSLSVSSLQVLDAAAAVAAPGDSVSGSSSSQGYVVPGTPSVELSLHMPSAIESSGSSQGCIEAHRGRTAMNVKSGIPILNVICGSQFSSPNSSGATVGGSEHTSGGRLGQPGLMQEQAHMVAQQQAGMVLRPLPKPLVSPFQIAANASFMLEGL